MIQVGLKPPLLAAISAPQAISSISTNSQNVAGQQAKRKGYGHSGDVCVYAEEGGHTDASILAMLLSHAMAECGTSRKSKNDA